MRRPRTRSVRGRAGGAARRGRGRPRSAPASPARARPPFGFYIGMRSYLRRLDPHLPRPVWLIQVGGLVNSLGNGVVIPFALIYLHNVRGFSFAVGGLALAVGSAAALLAGLAAGS